MRGLERFEFALEFRCLEISLKLDFGLLAVLPGKDDRVERQLLPRECRGLAGVFLSQAWLYVGERDVRLIGAVRVRVLARGNFLVQPAQIGRVDVKLHNVVAGRRVCRVASARERRAKRRSPTYEAISLHEGILRERGEPLPEDLVELVEVAA